MDTSVIDLGNFPVTTVIMSNSSGATPSTATAPAVTPAAAPAAPASSLPKQDSIIDRAQKSHSAVEVRRLAQEFLNSPESQPPAPAAEPAAPVPAEAPATETPAEETPAEPTEATPTPEDAPPAEEPVPAEPEQPEAPGPVPIPDANQLRIRPPTDDKQGRLAAAFMQRNKDWTMKQAMDAAAKQLGIEPEIAPTATPTPAQKTDLPATVEGVDSSIEALQVERLKAFTELRFEDVAKIDSSVRKLDVHRLKLERDGDRQQQAQAAAYDRQFDSSVTQSHALYDFATKPDSEGGKRMLEIEQALKETNDPLYNSPDKPLKIAQMVATELNIAPRRKGAPAPAKAAAPAVPAQKKQVLPGGSTAPAAVKPPAIDAKIQQANTPHALRKLVEEMGIKAI